MKRNLIGIVCFIKLFIVALSPTLAQQLIERPVVRLIYFVPRDSAPQPNINADLDRMIKRIRRHYANEMERHGYGRKTFNIETDANGNAVVHRLTGKLNAAVYPNDGDALFGQIEEEIGQRYNLSRNIYLVVAKTSAAIGGRGTDLGLLGAGGMALIPSFGSSFNFRIAAHELGHTFGLLHDFSNDNYLLSYGGGIELSVCDAEWLDLHRAFNESSPAANTPSNIKMLPPSLAAQPDAIRLRFEVSDPDGLHQVQLLAETLTGSAAGYLELIDCKQVKGNSATVEFVTTRLRPESKVVLLRTLDANRNSVSSGPFPIYVTQLLQQVREVSIPDANLAAAIREKIGNSITTYTLLYLRHLYARDREIRDLSGLEHAHNLKFLYLGGNAITDVSPLANLTQLTLLWMPGNAVSDLSQFTTMINLNYLYLSNNGITDVSPLTNLTHLKALDLGWNGISDVSPLANLTQLELLSLRDNYITDISPLLGLNLSGTEDDNTGLDIRGNPLNRASVQTHIPALQARGIAVESDPVKNLAPRAVGNVAPQTLRLGGEPLVLDMARYFRDPEGSTLTYGVWSNQSSIVRVEREGAQITITPVAKGTATVVVRASDPERLGDIQRISVTVNERENRAPQVVGSVAAQTLQVGGKPLVLDMSGYFQDPDENPLTYRVSLNPAGIVRVKRAGAQITITPVAKGTATVVVRASDPDGLHVSQNISVTVKKQPTIQPPIAVLIPDPVLARAIREEIGDSITTHTILNLTRLEVWANSLKGLSGLEHAHNLEELILKESRLTDLSPLATLTQLKSLEFRFNYGLRVSDLSPLANLTNLTKLYLDTPISTYLNLPSITDLSPLANLTKLEYLKLSHTNISDISVLTNLTKLEYLKLSHTNISDISVLTNLTNLKYLDLRDNNISDISPLVGLNFSGTDWTNTGLDITGNPLNYASVHTHIPAMQARRIVIAFDNRAHSALLKVSGDTQKSAAGTTLAAPLVVKALDPHGAPIAGRPVRFEVFEAYDTITATTTATTDANGEAQATIRLAPNLGVIRIHVEAEGIEYGVYFTAIATSPEPAEGASIPDANLASAIRKEIGDSITTHTILNLTSLETVGRGIRDLRGLEHAHNLTKLDLFYDDISDISPLANLTQLKYLGLGSTNISDISPLANLTQLESLRLYNNNISDISPLANLTQLEELNLWDNDISDISPLANLTQLESLGLGGTNISDISPLANLTNLEYLNLWDNDISDISPLANLTNLESLDLEDNDISDISPLANLTKLKYLDLEGKDLTDISPLANLTNLETLDLSANNISDISVLANLTNLEYLNLRDTAISDISPLLGLNLSGGGWSYRGLDIRGNPLNRASVEKHIPALQARGIVVEFDSPAHIKILREPPRNVSIPDANLAAAIRQEIGSSITTHTLLKLTGLYSSDDGIRDLSGLEHAHNLESLSLDGNDISDISVLAKLTQLESLSLYNNNISDISVLANLTNLKYLLSLSHNNISDISPLANLTQLEYLRLWDNDITDISPLANLTQLEDLNLYNNNISDISPLANLTLKYLSLSHNNISDISPLLGLNLSGRGWDDTGLDIRGNPLNRASLQTHIPALQARGVVVLFDKPAQAAPVLLPKETLLLTNYPNPFNPETWIPYQLAEPAEVTLRIYALNGALVRALELGHQPAGNYQSKGRAAYWDGRNELGERVASGLYFYTLTAGEFTATRKMLIRK